jgi:hypothetical protein
MEVSGQLHSFTVGETASATHGTGGCAGLIDGLDDLGKRKLFRPSRESNDDSSIIQPIALFTIRTELFS